MGILSGLKIFAVLAIITIVSSGIMYIVNLKADLVQSEANVKILDKGIATQKLTISALQKDIKGIQDINVELTASTRKYQQELVILNERFTIRANGESRDFGNIARSKPDIIKRIINKATIRIFDCLEMITGGPIKEGEKNSECQEFISSQSK